MEPTLGQGNNWAPRPGEMKINMSNDASTVTESYGPEPKCFRCGKPATHVARFFLVGLDLRKIPKPDFLWQLLRATIEFEPLPGRSAALQDLGLPPDPASRLYCADHASIYTLTDAPATQTIVGAIAEALIESRRLAARNRRDGKDHYKEGTSVCDSCGAVWLDTELNKVEHLLQRVEPGGKVPTGECPYCGALCYEV